MNKSSEEIRKKLRSGDFRGLLTEELGWNHYQSAPLTIEVSGSRYILTTYAEKCGLVVYGCIGEQGSDLPAYPERRKIESQVAKVAFEHMIIFHDASYQVQIWQWVLRQANRTPMFREHLFRIGEKEES